MPKTIQFKLDFNQDLGSYFKSKFPEFKQYRILSKSLDARGAPRGKKPVYHYILEVIKEGESFSSYKEEPKEVDTPSKPPIFIGAGPAGLFLEL